MISRSIVVPPYSALLYANPRIGWHTILPDAVVTASSEETDNSAALLHDYLTYDAWMATGAGDQWIEIETGGLETIDYIGLAAHNLATAGASFRVQYWDGGWVDAMDDYLPTYNTPIMYEFDPVTSTRFRVQILNSLTPVYIGVLFIGQIMHFERGVFIGHSPASYNYNDQVLNSVSEGGQFLGRSIISVGGKTSIDLNHLSAGYIRNTWVPFQDHARLKPFFFAWWPAQYPYEFIFGWSTTSPVPTVSGFSYYQVSIGMQGLIGTSEIES